MYSLHLSNTNINYDGRILKEMKAINGSDLPVSSLAYGVFQAEDASKKELGEKVENIQTINLLSSKLFFLPRSIKYTFMLFEYTVRAFFYGVKKKPDIVHCHDTFALPAGRFLKFIGAKLIYDAHELESNKNGQSGALAKATLLIEKVCWNKIDGFITVSQSILDWYGRNFSPVNSCVVLNTPSGLIEVKNSNYLREKFDILGSSLVFVYVGILGKGRGIEKLIHIFSNLKQSNLVFLGYGPLEVSVMDAANKYSNIHKHDAVPHDKVTSVIASADFGFCMIENSSLSDYLCLPNKLFEYAQSGVKIIGSNFPEISRVLNHYQIGISIEDNEDAILNVIKMLEKNKIELTPKSVKELSWEAQIDNLINLYRTVIS